MTDQTTNPAPNAVTEDAKAAALANSKLRLTAKLIPIIAPFLAVDDIRYYLAGVNVRPHPDGGAILCATNGRALAIIYDRAAICEAEVILNIDKRALKACAKPARDDRALVIADGRLTIIEKNGTEVYIQPSKPTITGAEYPQYKKFIRPDDQYVPGVTVSFDPKILAVSDLVVDAMCRAELPGTGARVAAFFTTVDGEQTLVRVEGASDFLAILMPKRAAPIKAPIESWVPRLSPETVPAGAQP